MRRFFATLSIALVMSAPVGGQEATASFSEYVPSSFPAERTNPRQIVGSVGLKLCEQLQARGDYVFYRFEGEALTKEKRLGKLALDADDVKWVMNATLREQACMSLLEKAGKLGLADRWRRFWSR